MLFAVTILLVRFVCSSTASLAWLFSTVYSCNRLSVSSSLIRMRLSALLITNPSRSIFSVAPKSSDCADCQIFIVCWWRSCVCLLLCRLVLLPSISYDFFPVSFLTILPCARSLSLLHRIWLTFGSSGTNLVTCDNCFGFLSLLLLSIHAFFSFAFNCIQLHSIIPRFS